MLTGIKSHIGGETGISITMYEIVIKSSLDAKKDLNRGSSIERPGG